MALTNVSELINSWTYVIFKSNTKNPYTESIIETELIIETEPTRKFKEHQETQLQLSLDWR